MPDRVRAGELGAFPVLMLVVILAIVPVDAARARASGDAGPPPSDWTLLSGYPGGSQRLALLPQGGLISQGDTALFRSDDASATWRAVPNPPDGRAISADPSDERVVYGTTATGLVRTSDGGVTWRLLRAAPTGRTESASTAVFVIDPGDPRELFLAELDTILRSSDAGTTWQVIYTISHAGSPCVAAVTVLIPTRWMLAGWLPMRAATRAVISALRSVRPRTLAGHGPPCSRTVRRLCRDASAAVRACNPAAGT